MVLSYRNLLSFMVAFISVLIFAACEMDEIPDNNLIIVDAELPIRMDAGLTLEVTVSAWIETAEEYAPSSGIDEQAVLDRKIDIGLMNANDLFCNRLGIDDPKYTNDVACSIRLQRKGHTSIIAEELDLIDAYYIFDGVANTSITDYLFSHNRQNLHNNIAFTNLMIVGSIVACEGFDDPFGCTKPLTGGSMITYERFYAPDNVLAHEMGHLLIDHTKMPLGQGHLLCDKRIQYNYEQPQGQAKISHTYDSNHTIYMTQCPINPDSSEPYEYVVIPEICNLALHPTDDRKAMIRNVGGEVKNEVENYQTICPQ